MSTRGLYGGERVLVNLVGHSDPHKVISLTAILFDPEKPADDVLLALEAQNSPYLVIPCEKRFDLKAMRSIVKIIREYNIDIIHCHEIKGRLYGLLTAKYSHLPIITSHHNWIRNKLSTTIFEYLDAFYIRFFDRIIPVSSSIWHMLRRYAIPADKMRVIINGIDLEEKDHYNSRKIELRRSLHINEKNYIIGVVGRLSTEKGQRYFLEAARLILRERKDVSFVIVGDGHLREELEEFARSLKICEQIIFTGFRQDVETFYSLFDICIMPSLIEGTPMALLEAMAHEVCVVASDVGGIPDIINNMKNGILVQPRDSGAIARAVNLVLDDFNLQEKLVKNAVKTIHERFSADRMAAQYEEEYRTLTAGK